MKLLVEYLDHYAGEPLAYATEGAAGIDLPAAEGRHVVPGNGSLLIPTGVVAAIPQGTFGRIVMRSGHGIKRDLSCHVGTIDSDYRGEIMVLVRNHRKKDVEIQPGERFAQLIIEPYVRAEIVTGEAMPQTARGANGFGSTGH